MKATQTLQFSEINIIFFPNEKVGAERRQKLFQGYTELPFKNVNQVMSLSFDSLSLHF